MGHYFIFDASLPPNFQSFTYCFKNLEYSFTANSGIFSPDHVDPASDLLIHRVPQLSGSLLDLGCGYGPIGIVLGKAYGLSVTFADINSRALECAEINCNKNGIPPNIIQSDAFDSINGCFDTITLNPPIHAGKQLIFKMYEESHSHLNPGGALYIVIQEKHGAKSSIKKLCQVYGRCDITYKRKGYYILQCRV